MRPPRGGTGGDVPVHSLRPNEAVWTPPCVVFLDTETTWTDDGPDEVHRLRLWAAVRVDRRNIRKTQPAEVWGRGRTPADLAAWLTVMTKGRDSVWLYAHNLNFDLVTTALPIWLAREGWEVGDFAVTTAAPWMRFRRAGKTLTVVDSWSWLPESLESLGHRQGLSKVTLPDNDDIDEMWDRRCASDVEILKRCVLALMDWWDANSLGRWTISGAGCGWNAMRHMPTLQRHVIDVTPELVAQDRQAVRGGRKDAQVVRSHGGGPWAELDLVAAYPTVARMLPLPVKRAWRFDSLPLDSRWIESRFYGPIARCVVTTDVPRYPVRHGGRTWFPVGTFRTVLAGPEIAWARANGDLRAVEGGQMHKLGFALRPWATWVLDPARGGTVDVPPVGYVAAKAWGRSVIGKFAARTHSSIALEGPADPGWKVTEGWNNSAKRRMHQVEMAGSAWLVTHDLDTENCYPAVLAWVESAVRVRLGRVLEALPGSWWTCDTDGLTVDLSNSLIRLQGGALRLEDHTRDEWGLAQVVCEDLAQLVAPLVIRPKRIVHSLAVLGPQHLTVDGERRYSGLPRTAVETAPHTFTVRDWPKLKWQIGHGVPGMYRRPAREVTFTGPTVHRWVGADGWAYPVEMTIDPGGENVLLPWSESRWSARGVELGPEQYERLERLA